MTRREMLSMLPPAAFAVRGGILRPSDNFDESFSRADGSLGNGWQGATWSISDGAAVNAATLGAETLADPSLEATYSSGLCSTLTKDGSPTVAESADAQDGSKAQSITAVAAANAVRWPLIAGVANAWWQFSTWSKRTAGTSGTNCQMLFASNGSAPENSMTKRHESASYTKKVMVFRSPDTGSQYLYAARETAASNFDTVIVDNVSLKQVTLASTFATRTSKLKDVSVQATLTGVDGVAGVVARLDSSAAPQSFIICYVFKTSVYWKLIIEKCVAGVYSQVGSIAFLNTGNLASITGCLELNCSGSTVTAYWDGIQQAQGTVSDAQIVSNTIHGLFSCGSSSFMTFGISNPVSSHSVLYAGSSITTLAPPTHPLSYQGLSRSWLRESYPSLRFGFSNMAMSGANTWHNLVRWPASGRSVAPKLVILDYANDGNTDHHKRSCEAFIRKVWADFPGCKIIALKFFAVADRLVDDPTPTASSLAAIATWDALTSYYGIPQVDYQAAVANLVTSQGHNLTEYFGDNIHPNDGGHALASSLLTPFLTNAFIHGRQAPLTLPARLYDNGDYEFDATVKLGSQYDSRAGTWTDPSGVPTTSTVGSTITFSATCCSFGMIATGSFTVNVSFDGGAFQDISAYGNGGYIGPRASHTITIKFTGGSSMAVSEFWAV